jgi:hypothetical protein
MTRWAGHDTYGRKINAYTVLVGKPEEEKQLEMLVLMIILNWIVQEYPRPSGL